MEKFLSAFSKLDCKDKLKTTYESVMVERISASRSKKYGICVLSERGVDAIPRDSSDGAAII